MTSAQARSSMSMLVRDIQGTLHQGGKGRNAIGLGVPGLFLVVAACRRHVGQASRLWRVGSSLISPAGFLFGKAQLVELLQVQPELRAGAEEVGQAQGGVAGDCPPAVEDCGYAVGGNLDLPGECCGAHFELSQLLWQGVRRDGLPGWAMLRLLVIVVDFKALGRQM